MNLRTSKAVTLIELLIAAILVGIVMLGAVSVDFAIRRGRQNMVSSNRMAMELEASMLQMTRDAMATTGYYGENNDGNNGNWIDSGIDADGSGPILNICFRNIPDNDPNTFPGDDWTCYSQVTAQYDILRCDNGNSPLGTDGTCPGGSQVMHENDGANPFFIINTNPLNIDDIESITFDLRTCEDLSQAENPTSNPCFSIQSVVSPPSVSRQLR